jgi:hypothetical protein
MRVTKGIRIGLSWTGTGVLQGTPSPLGERGGASVRLLFLCPPMRFWPAFLSNGNWSVMCSLRSVFCRTGFSVFN